MNDVTTELKGLRLHGMASAWTDLMAQGATSTESSRWLIEHLLQAETTDRAMRSVSHQMNVAKFPVHRDLAGFDFGSSKVDQHLVKQLATLSFTDAAQNAVFIGGPGTGKTHLATAIRSGSANLNSAISGNSGYKAGSKVVWEQGVSNGEEEGIGTAHTPYP